MAGAPFAATSEGTARQNFRKRLREGQLDEREIEIDLAEARPSMEIMGPAGMEEMAEQLRGMFSQMGAGKRQTRKLRIAEAMKLLIEEEAGKGFVKFVGLEVAPVGDVLIAHTKEPR